VHVRGCPTPSAGGALTMTVEAPEEPSGGASRPDHLRTDGRPSSAVWGLLLFQTAALTLQVVAVSMAWSGMSGPANLVSCLGFALTFASALWALIRPQMDRALRNTAVVCLGVTTTVQWRMIDPLLFKGYDEQLHMRTLSDIEASHSLFQPQPILPVSPRYPGLEALAAFFHQFGLPLMFAATIVVLLARLALVLTLCAAVEHSTGSPRAGGLAVAVYAISPQFVFFNSQFAYQSLSLPLALAAVAFIARARWSENVKPLFGGATLCLLAVALTHHLTSLLTATFLLMWALSESKGQARRRVFCGAVVAALATAIWAAIQWSLLRDYFGPMIEDVNAQLTQGVQRTPFSESSADPKPPWERVLLVYYAVVVTMTVSWLIVISTRPIIRRVRGASSSHPVGHSECKPHRWEPRTLLVLLMASIPVLFAARVLPRCGEISDRASTFLYLPFSLLVVGGALQWFRYGRHAREPRPRPAKALQRSLGGTRGRSVVLTLATAAFLGGYLLGAGSAWARLPGGYLPGGDGRSMDAETLAAVRWAGDNLPAGSRIGADRLSSTLLASQARLWPVFTHDDTPEVAWLYQADDWGQRESDIARRKQLRYLFVDRRFAGATPLVGTYFDESPPLKLTRADLTKFNSVPGIQEIYRHGPMSIYDLSGLGVPEVRSGWFIQAQPLTIPTQAMIGFLIGVALSLIARVDAGIRAIGFVRSIFKAAGPLLAFPFSLAALCITSVMMILTRIWLGPWIFVAVALTVLFMNPHTSLRLFKIAAAKFRWTWFAVAGSLVLAVAVLITISAFHASAARQLTPTGSAWCANGDCDDI
jgi:hypothetical protein